MKAAYSYNSYKNWQKFAIFTTLKKKCPKNNDRSRYLNFKRIKNMRKFRMQIGVALILRMYASMYQGVASN